MLLAFVLILAGDLRTDAAEPWVEGRAAGDVQAQLVQITELIEQGQADAGIDLLLRLLDRSGSQLVRQNSGPLLTVYHPLRQVVFGRMVSSAPAWQAAREAYRRRVDGLVESQWQRAWQAKDGQRMEWLVETYFPSSWTDQVLNGLATLALEHGDAEMARRWWGRIDPIRYQQVYPTEVSGADSLLIHPDTDVDPAMLQAGLVLASLQEGAWDRAAQELALLASQYPDAHGTLWGNSVHLVETLQPWLDRARGQQPPSRSPRSWATYAGNHQRNSVFDQLDGGGWDIDWTSVLPTVPPVDSAIAQRHGLPEVASGDSYDTPCSYFPLIGGDRLYVPLDGGYQEVRLSDGEAVRTIRPLDGSGEPLELETGVSPRYLAELSEQWIALTIDYPQGERENQRSGVLAVCDVTAEGRVELVVEAPGEWEFAGPPLIDAGRMWVAITERGELMRSGVAAYHLATGQLLWTRSLVANSNTTSPAAAVASAGDAPTARVLTKAGPWLFVPADGAAVACLGAHQGDVRWIATYSSPDSSPWNLLDRAWHRLRRPVSCLYSGGRLFVAPADHPGLLALDAATGNLLWQAQVPHGTFDATHLVGVIGGRLIATGRRVWWIDVQSGALASMAENPYPFAMDSRLVGVGRGLILGGILYWPARGDGDWLVSLDAMTGQPLAAPLALPQSGNLIAVGDRLLVAGSSQLTALRRQEASVSEGGTHPVEGSSGTMRKTTADSRRLAEFSPSAPVTP